jgi:hypothetical protein
MRRSVMGLIGGLAVTAGTLAVATPASADPDNDLTLPFTMSCPDGDYDVVIQPANTAAFHVVDSTATFVWKRIEFTTPGGETGAINRGIQGPGHTDLVTCTYTGAVSGNAYVVTGFFTG